MWAPRRSSARSAPRGLLDRHREEPGAPGAGWSCLQTRRTPEGASCGLRNDGGVADETDVRKIALSLDGVVEIESDGFDFRVNNRGFIWSYPERIPGERRVIRTDIAVLYVGDAAEQQALLKGEPDKFFTAPGYENWPLVLLRLEKVGVRRLRELITDAWRMRLDRVSQP
jgi:hypothetical protein